jgi:hypothetical protein
MSGAPLATAGGYLTVVHRRTANFLCYFLEEFRIFLTFILWLVLNRILHFHWMTISSLVVKKTRKLLKILQRKTAIRTKNLSISTPGSLYDTFEQT